MKIYTAYVKDNFENKRKASSGMTFLFNFFLCQWIPIHFIHGWDALDRVKIAPVCSFAVVLYLGREYDVP